MGLMSSGLNMATGTGLITSQALRALALVMGRIQLGRASTAVQTRAEMSLTGTSNKGLSSNDCSMNN